MNTASDRIAAAVERWAAGDVAGALTLLRASMVEAPDGYATLVNAARLQLAGAAAADALIMSGRACRLAPNRPEAWGGAARAWLALDPGRAVLDHARIALVLDPGAPSSSDLMARGLTRVDVGRALSFARRSLALAPDDAAAHETLGELYALRGDGCAASAFRRTVLLDPGRSTGYARLADGPAVVGDAPSPIGLLRRGLGVEPGSPSILARLAVAVVDGGRANDNRPILAAAVMAAPDRHDLIGNLGVALMSAGQSGPARRALTRARRIDPQSVPGLVNLGLLARDAGRLDEALGLLRAAGCAAPDRAEALQGVGLIVAGIGDVAHAARLLRRVLTIDPGYARAHSNLIFIINHVSNVSEEEIRAVTRDWGRRHVPPSRGAGGRPAAARRSGPLRVGFLSADLHEHPIAHNLEDLFVGLANSPLELHVYVDSSVSDATNARLRSIVEPRWRQLDGLDDAAVARLIAADGIDVLVLVAPHSGGNRPGVAGYRPAPVIVSFGELGTTGLSAVDYWITDRFHHPGAISEGFSETLLRLPVFTLHRPPADAPPVLPRDGAAGRPVLFGCFGKPAKINAPVAALWSRVLEAVPGSRLVLKFATYYGDRSVRERISALFGGLGAERLIFEAANETRPAHLARLGRIDIALDPFPFNGCTTTFEALWMGVPVVALAGTRFVGRLGAGILLAAGLDELVARDADDYVRIATGLAGDRARLDALRRALRPRLAGSALCRPEDYVAAFVAAMTDIATRHRLRDA